MSEELKNCPFCGGEATLCHDMLGDGKEWFYIVCGDCGTCSDHVSAEEIAVRIWNTRPAEDRLKAENERLKEELEELRYIVEQFSKWTAEGGCVKANFPDFPCWWERNSIELELDDYCDPEDEIEHKCWVEYYRWKYRQKLDKDTDIPSNAPNMDDGRKTETNGTKPEIVEMTLEISDGVKMVFTIPYIEETREWVEYETNMPGWERK